MDLVERFEAMLASGKDTALIRYSLGVEYLKREQLDAALSHLDAAVRHDPGYSAAWKQLGNALLKAGRLEDARRTYVSGIEVAERRGDRQAAKEMSVFLRRVEKQLGG